MNFYFFKTLLLFIIICFQFFGASENILKINSFETSFNLYKDEILSQVFNYHLKDKNATHVFYRLVFYETMKFYPVNYTPFLTFGVKNEDKDYVLEEYKIKEYLKYFHLKIKLHQLDYPKYFSWKFLSETICSFFHKKLYFLLLIGIICKLVINIKKQYELRNNHYLSIYTQVIMYDLIILLLIIVKISQLNAYYFSKTNDLNNWSYKLILSFLEFFKKMTQHILSSFLIGLTYNGENIEFTLDFIFAVFYKASGEFDLTLKDIFFGEPILVYFTFLVLFIGLPLFSFNILKKLYKLKSIFQNNIQNDQKFYLDILKTLQIKFFKILSVTISYMILILGMTLLYNLKEKINKEIYDILYFIIVISFSCAIGYIYYPIVLPISYYTPLNNLENIEIKRHLIYKSNINKFDYSTRDFIELVDKYQKEFKDYEKDDNKNKGENKNLNKEYYIPFVIINPFTKKVNEKYSLNNIQDLHIGKKYCK